MISGLETITSGELFLKGKLVNHMDPGDRNIGMVFQNYALFPHMTVEKNISYGLRVNRIPEAEIKKRVTDAADIRQIMHWAGKYTEDADIVIEYEPHEKLTHAELLDEMHELRSWVEEGKALS